MGLELRQEPKNSIDYDVVDDNPKRDEDGYC